MENTKIHIVVARRFAPGWFEVVKDYTPPNDDIDYPYMRAAHADAHACGSASSAEFVACLLRAPIRVGKNFNWLTERADLIDRYSLRIAKRSIFQ